MTVSERPTDSGALGTHITFRPPVAMVAPSLAEPPSWIEPTA